jgi:proteasome maturation protein
MVCNLQLTAVVANTMYQEPSLRLVPANAPVKASISDTANSLGLHDTLKYGPRTLADEIKSTNPLQSRLENVC